MGKNNSKKLGIHYAWWIMIACAMIYAASVGIIVNNAGLLYNAVASDLGIGISQISFYTTIMYGTVAICLPFSGQVLKKFDLRWILTVSGILNALAFGLMSIYSQVWQFYLSGLILGIGSTFLIYGTIPIIINNWFSTKSGTALGAAQAFMGIGGAISAPIAGRLLETTGWQGTYASLGIAVAILIIPVALLIIREKPSDIGMTPFGAKVSNETDNSVELVNPGVDAEIATKSGAFYLIIIFTFVFGLVSTVSFHVPNFAQSIGFDPTTAATAITAISIAQTLGKFLIGWINDRFGAKAAVLSGVGAGLVGVIVLLLSDSFGAVGLIAGAFLFGFGYSASTLLPPTVITATFGRKDYASIYTKIMSVSPLGVAVGTTLFGYIFDVTASYYAVFITVMVLFVVAVITSFLALNQKKTFVEKGFMNADYRDKNF